MLNSTLASFYSHPKNLNFSTFQANSFFSHADGRKNLQEFHTESERNSAHRSCQLLLITLITNEQFFMKLGHKIWVLPNQRISNVYYVNFTSVASLLKFMFSKKATKIDQIFTVDLTLCRHVVCKCQIDS